MSNLANDAYEFAAYQHGKRGQLRKYTDEPYIVHPQEVACIISMVPGCTEEMIAAAFLHDVVEDTDVHSFEIHDKFGREVGELVDWLTDISRPQDGNRAKRKELDRLHIAQAPTSAKNIKLADLISNTRSIVENDPKFAVVYLQEKRLLLSVLSDANPGLVKTANATLSNGLKFIKEQYPHLLKVNVRKP